MRGQRELRVTMTPFSTEKESAGRPAMVQSLTSLGSAKKEAKSNSSDAGRFRALTCNFCIHDELAWPNFCAKTLFRRCSQCAALVYS